MKTRDEMIYDFMVALASNSKACDPSGKGEFDVYEHASYQVMHLACALTDKYQEEIYEDN